MKARDWIVRGLALAMVLSAGVTLPAYAQQAAVPGQQPAAPAQLPAAAQNTGLKIAVINGDRVILESRIGILVQQEAQAAAMDWDNRVGQKQGELDTLVAQAQEQRLTLTDEALGRMQTLIQQLQVDVQRLSDDANRALQRMAEEAQVRINNVLIPAVERLANDEGYDLILDTRIAGILYFADAIDATDRYIALVNADNPPPQRGNQR